MAVYIRLLPGVKIRLSKRGVRWYLGHRAAWLHPGADGTWAGPAMQVGPPAREEAGSLAGGHLLPGQHSTEIAAAWPGSDGPPA